MAKKRKPVAGRDYDTLDNGVIAVKRCFTNLDDPYDKREKIPDYLSQVDHTLQIKRKKTYRKALLREETEFNTLVRKMKDAGRSLMIVFQGRDTAGKSGATERIMQALDYDPKLFLWVPIGPPTDTEKAHSYLWRFFTGERMPEFGQVRVYDRSWFERVLVEPVMKLTPTKDVRKSYSELRMFEKLLTSQGGVVVKLWMDITPDEQSRRFKARAANKPWKLSAADKIARKHWDDYTGAANEMFHRTGTTFAPWYIVSSEDKRYSRVAVLQTINKALREHLK
jgi:AMP-polyphosphate phosphotransferase